MKPCYTSEYIEEETMENKETLSDTRTKLEQLESNYQFARLENVLEGLSNLHNVGAFCSDKAKIKMHQKWDLATEVTETIWFESGDTTYKIQVEKKKT